MNSSATGVVYHLHLVAAAHIYVGAEPPFLKALGMEELCQTVPKLDWKDLNQELKIWVSSTKSRLFHTKGIAERVDRGSSKSLASEIKAACPRNQFNLP